MAPLRPGTALSQLQLLSAQSELAREFDITDLQVVQIEEAFQLLAVQVFHAPFSDERWGVLELVDVRRALLAIGLTYTPSHSRLLVSEPGQQYVTYRAFSVLAAALLHRRHREQLRQKAERPQTRSPASPSADPASARLVEAFRLFTRAGKGQFQSHITLSTLQRVVRELREDVSDEWLKTMILYANNGDSVRSDKAAVSSGWQKGVSADEFAAIMDRVDAFR